MKRFLLGLAAVALVSAGFVACGGDDEKPDLTPYLGQWNIGQGNLNMQCTGLGPQNASVSGAVSIAKGTAADLVVTLSDPTFQGCALQMNVKGNVATPLTNQSCTFSFQGITGTFTVTTGSLTFASDMQANMNLSGTANAQLLVPIMCQGTVTAGLSRTASMSDAGAQDAAATSDTATAVDGASRTDGAAGDAANVADAGTGG